jgi:hypothetical protein
MQFHVFDKAAALSLNICYPYPYNRDVPYFKSLSKNEKGYEGMIRIKDTKKRRKFKYERIYSLLKRKSGRNIC